MGVYDHGHSFATEVFKNFSDIADADRVEVAASP